LARHTVNDILLSLITIKSPYPPHLLSLLESSLIYLSDNASDEIYQLSLPEQFISKGWTLLQGIIIFEVFGSSDKRASKNLTEDINTLLTWTTDLKKLPELPFEKASVELLPSAEFLQDIYLRLELLQAIHRTSDFLSSRMKGLPSASKDIPKKIKTAAQEAGKTINQVGTDWKNALKKEGTVMIDKLLAASVTGDDVTEILDLQSGPRYVGPLEVCDAAIDAVEGVEKVRVG
jgi:hypothetical protein